MHYTRETLVAELRKLGVAYLAPSDAIATEAVPSTGDLLLALLEQNDSRLKLAMIPLFLRHPATAQDVARLVEKVDAQSALELQTVYMIAVYLQRLWKTRLGFYLDTAHFLPDIYSHQLALPPAEERFGKNGLYDLTDAWKARSRYPFDRLAAVNSTMELFFEQLKLENSGVKYAPAS